jgi:hypothetical protein
VDGPERVGRAVAEWGDFIAGETLAVELEAGEAAVEALASRLDDDVDGDPVHVALSRVLD